MTDGSDVRRWQAALERVAARIGAERGVHEPVRTETRDDTLWACFGPRRIRVAGPGAEVADEDALFAEVDHWVAFVHGGGPLLDRDRAYVEAFRAGLPAVVASWQAYVDLVAADLARTTDLAGPWRVVLVSEREPRAPRASRGQGAHHSTLTLRFGALPEPVRVPLLLPEVWLSWPGGSRSLPASSVDAEEGVALVADHLQEWAIDQLWGAWPPCPSHGHPMAVSGTAWVCPVDPAVRVAVGRLGT